jgi:hypothetical protein
MGHIIAPLCFLMNLYKGAERPLRVDQKVNYANLFLVNIKVCLGTSPIYQFTTLQRL